MLITRSSSLQLMVPLADNLGRDRAWMLEELRLSLFAQPLGAQGPISMQRIRKSLSV